MQVRQLQVRDAVEITPALHPDERGLFLELYRADVLADVVGHPLRLAQANVSVSGAGVLRGVHYADVPPSQAKYVTCLHGRVLDVVVDLRAGSPTFGRWEAVVLDDVTRRAVYVPEGLGHAFLALSGGAAVTYLCSAPYEPGREHGVDALDPALSIPWADWLPPGVQVVRSERDASAPALADAVLPSYEECLRWYEALRS